MLGSSPSSAPAPFEENFKAHHYTLDGEFSQTGQFKLLFVDEDERPTGNKIPKTK
jgi:hypothetical protein